MHNAMLRALLISAGKDFERFLTLILKDANLRDELTR